MRDLTLAKARELQAACSATHIPAPPLQTILADLSAASSAAAATRATNSLAAGDSAAPGHISEVLARVVRALAEVTAEGERRRTLVAAIHEVQQARSETAWLRDYEADINRFKASTSEPPLLSVHA
jgi:hypothetical protein